MTRVISDFIKSADTTNGFGIYKGDDLAAWLSANIPKSQKQLFERYGVVPGAFFLYLKKRQIIRADARIPEAKTFVTISGKKISVRHISRLPELLQNLPCVNEKAKRDMQHLIDVISKAYWMPPREVKLRYRKPWHGDSFEDTTRRYTKT